MNYYAYFLVPSLLLLIACNPSTQEKEDSKSVTKNHQPDSTEQEVPPVLLNSTEFQYPEITTPDHFTIETIRNNNPDSGYHLSAEVFLPKTDESLKMAIVDQIKMDFKKTIEGLKDDFSEELSYTSLWKPVNYLINDSICSISYVIDEYTEGGNHHNYDWLTFNYFKKKKQHLGLSDFLSIDTDENQGKLLELLETNNTGSCHQWEFPYRHFEDVQIAFKEDSLTFHPYPQWSCGMPTTTISLQDLMPFIK